MQLDLALEKFLTQLTADGRAQATAEQYARHASSLVRWLKAEKRSAEIQAIDHEVLAEFLSSPTARQRADGKTKRPTSANALRSSLRCLFKYLHDAGFLGENAARLIRAARSSPPPPRGLSEPERERFLAVLAAGKGADAERDRALFGTMLLAGTRLGATLRLAAEDVDLDRDELHIRHDKGGRSDVVLLGPEAVENLRGYLAARPIGLLFPGRDGKPLCRRHAQRRFRVWARKAGIGDAASSHALRHSFASALLARTGDVTLVQKALCHKSIAASMAYVRVPDDRLRRALRT